MVSLNRKYCQIGFESLVVIHISVDIQLSRGDVIAYKMNREGKRLAEIVKKTHKKLRRRYKQGEDEAQLWKEHVQHENQLQTYASAMHELATTHWQANQQTNMSRVSWTYDAIKQYFHGGELQRITEKEMRKLKHLQLEAEPLDTAYRFDDSSKIKVLDVGSCYNPFSIYSDLDVTAVDLWPASKAVKQCDFLNLQVGHDDGEYLQGNYKEDMSGTDNQSSSASSDGASELRSKEHSADESVVENLLTSKDEEEDTAKQEITSSLATFTETKSVCELQTKDTDKHATENTVTHLESNSFDVVIFCLLLEYIPSPKQRYQCCKKAYNLLKPNGILCIITPDSKHQNANVHIYKLWKITLAFLGFSRTKYEKHTHFHGMVFRKGLCRKAWALDAEREMAVMKKTQVKSKFESINYEKVCTEIYIPQDFQEFSESEEDAPEGE